MLYSPKDLRLVPVKEVPTGAIAEMIGRAADIPLFLRLADIGDKPRLMLLGGNYSFEVPEWGVEDAMARVVCEPEDVLVKVNEPEERQDQTKAGMLVLRNGGAFISSKPRQGSFHSVRIDLATWAETDENGRHGELVFYPQWEMGKVDRKGEFNSIFKK